MGGNNYSDSLRIMGTILIFTPLIVALPAIFYAAVTGKNVSLGDGGTAYAAGLMIMAGLITDIRLCEGIQKELEGNINDYYRI